jgi:3',5'-cyclic AMP phosphodiesterase CpdA
VVIAHISDLHVSRFGEHVGSWSGRRAHGSRLTRGSEWAEVEEVDGWRVERRRSELRLVDEAGKLQVRRKLASDETEAHGRRALVAQARLRMRFHHARLAEEAPAPSELKAQLAEDPDNTNLLFCRLARVLDEDAPDWILISGDVTDDGVGYDLVLGRLAKFVARGRLLAVPGNHDIYDSPLGAVPRHARKKESDKRAAWEKFAARLGLSTSPWVQPLGAGVVMAGLDSCHPPRVPLSASGKILEHDLDMVEDELRRHSGVRLAMLHHHVVNPPKNAVGRAPIQLGLRLRNADTVYQRFRKLQLTVVLNGHRHIGYRFQAPHSPLILSSPSTTLGCLSGAPRPYYWRLEVDAGGVRSVRERPL